MMEVGKLQKILNEQDSSEYEKIIEELKQELHSKENEISNLENINEEVKK